MEDPAGRTVIKLCDRETLIAEREQKLLVISKLTFYFFCKISIYGKLKRWLNAKKLKS